MAIFNASRSYSNLKSDINKRIASVEKGIRASFEKVKEEFDEHLDSINQNTNEIQQNYEYLCRLDMKIEKLSERIDEISLFIKQLVKMNSTSEVMSLTENEKRVFLAIYESEKKPLTYSDIAERTGKDEQLIAHYIENLLLKRIPLIRTTQGNVSYFSLESSFKELQARKNILNINSQMKQVF